MKKSASYLSKNCWICSNHFEAQFLPKYSNIRRRLSADAVPTIFDVPNQPPIIGSKRPLPWSRQQGRGPFKKYVRSEGGGVPKKGYENVQGGKGDSSTSVRTLA